jgi:hypothetical protein
MNATMVAPFGAAAAIIVPVAAVIVAAAEATPVVATTMVVAAIVATIGTVITAMIVVAILLAMAPVALGFGWRGHAEAERGEGESGGDEIRELHEVSSCPRSGWKDDTILVRHRS